MELDWNVDEPLAERTRSPPPRVRVDQGSLEAGTISSAERVYRENRLLDVFSRRVELDPSPEAFGARAAAFEKVGDWLSALSDLDRMLEADPDDPELLGRRAAAQERLGRSMRLSELRTRARTRADSGMSGIAGALADWKDVLALKPGDFEASTCVAYLWIVERCAAQTGEVVDPGDEDARLALACAEMTFGTDAENASYARDLGAMYYHFGRLDEARPLLEKAWRLSPAVYTALLHLSMIEHRQGDPSRARRLFEEAAGEGRKSLKEGSSMRQFHEAMVGCAERTLARPAPAERP